MPSKRAGNTSNWPSATPSPKSGGLGGPIYNRSTTTSKRPGEFQDMGADSICIKDMGGLLAPYDAFDLVTALKPVLNVPFQLHTHYTSGMASMTVLKAIEAGAWTLSTRASPRSPCARRSPPSSHWKWRCVVPSAIAASTSPLLDPGGRRLPGVHPAKVRDTSMQDPRSAVIDVRVLEPPDTGRHGEQPDLPATGGRTLSTGSTEVLEEVPRTRRDLGNPPLVTPMSQMVGSQSVSNVLFGRLRHGLGAWCGSTPPECTASPPAQLDPEERSIALRGDARDMTADFGQAVEPCSRRSWSGPQ